MKALRKPRDLMADTPMLKFVAIGRDMPDKRSADVRTFTRSMPSMPPPRPGSRPEGAANAECPIARPIVRCTTTFRTG